MKKIPMILMLCAPYMLFGLYMISDIEIFPVGLVLFVAVIIFGAVYAFFLPQIGYSGKQILFWCMLLKIFYIPVFIFVFIAVIGLYVFIIPLIPLLIIFDYLLLLATSMYGLNGLLKCRKDMCLPSKVLIVNIALQFLFCADVVSAVYCYVKVCKNTYYKDAKNQLQNCEFF